MIIGLAFTVIVARKLGPEGFGAYAYVLSFVTILSPLARFGMEAHVMREAASDEAGKGSIYVSLAASAITTVLAAAITVVAFLLSNNPAGVTPILLIVALPILLAAPFDLVVAYLKGREQMKQFAIPRMIASIAFVIASLLVFVFTPYPRYFVMLRSMESIFLGVAAIASFVLIGGAAFQTIKLDMLKKTLAEALPLMIAVFSTMIFLRIDQVFLGQLSNEEELGRYAVAARIVEIGNIAPAVLQSTLLGAMVRNFQSGPGGLDPHMQAVFDLFALSGWVAAIALGVAAALFLEPVFGSAYAGSMPMLWVLLLGTPFYFLFYAIASELTATGSYWNSALLTGTGAITNIGLNFLLVPRFGGVGAAWASVVAYFVAGIGMTYLSVNYRGSSRKMVLALNPLGSASRLISVCCSDARQGKQMWIRFLFGPRK
ncbi:flippase [Novosphingobium sp. G106]|uniref:flippase n=1 Tax=Novosphingobium sp. G106 TaxID=2849500 RepID=UPI001C2DD941|nr:flippase [Novosphingobium sp. G106]MBV1689345.1 flippase [Novosphingobium sp. G106]